MKTITCFITVIAVFTGTTAIAQQKTLLPYDFINMVKAHHPVIRQAAIGVDMAGAALLSARGGFDPLFYLNTAQKTFDGKNYYQYTNPELKIPTWYGIEVKAGTENNGGQFLNSENTPGRTSYIGVNLPLAKNLLMDKRRAVLQQARIMQQQSLADQRLLVNDLLYDAWSSYFEWQQYYLVYQVITQAIKVNEQRFALIKRTWQLGERAAIDTVEAQSQLLTFRLMQNDALLNWNNAGVQLANYLWSSDGNPVLPYNDIIPDTAVAINNTVLPVLEDLLQAARSRHPKLQQFGFKLNWLEVERKLKFQSLLPTFNLKYNLLNKGYNVVKDFNARLLENNYKFGIELGIPLALRQGRGDYQAVKLKQRDTRLEQDLQIRSIETKVEQYFNSIFNLRNQVNVALDLLATYRRLLQAEETRFSLGESSLFLINTRENKALEGALKLAELQVKFNKSLIAAAWAAGQLQ